MVKNNHHNPNPKKGQSKVKNRVADFVIAACTTGEKSPVTIENDTGLIELMQRAQDEIYGGNAKVFEAAYADALAAEIADLSEADDFSDDLSEELADAMRGVLLQWIGEYPCYPKRDIPGFLRRIVAVS